MVDCFDGIQSLIPSSLKIKHYREKIRWVVDITAALIETAAKVKL